MVKGSRVLEQEVDQAAELPYGRTRLAQRAPAARRRLTGILLVGSLALVIEAAASSYTWLVPAALVVLTAWGVARARLGGLIAAGLTAALAAFLPLAFAAFLLRSASTLVALGVSFVLGVAALPDVLLLMRDAELQDAYGFWARR